MWEISLLPAEYRERELVKRQTLLVHTVALSVIGAMFLLYAVSFGAAFFSRQEYRSFQVRRISCEREIASLKPYADLDNRYQKAVELSNEIYDTFRPWEAFLSGIGLNVPEGVWLTELALTRAGTQSSAQQSGSSSEGGQSEGTAQASAPKSLYTCSLKGWALGHFQLARFLDKLQGVEQLSNIKCRTISTGEYNESPAVQFEITADLWSVSRASGEGGV